MSDSANDASNCPPPRTDLFAESSDINRYLKRKEEVRAKDLGEFRSYLDREKSQTRSPRAPNKALVAKLSRRGALKMGAGAAVVSGVAGLACTSTNGGALAEPSLSQAGGRSAGAQAQNILRELTNSKADIGGRGIGRYILLLPTKLGGGTYAMTSIRVGCWPGFAIGITATTTRSLIICAPFRAPPDGVFELINSTQGGKNV